MREKVRQKSGFKVDRGIDSAADLPGTDGRYEKDSSRAGVTGTESGSQVCTDHKMSLSGCAKFFYVDDDVELPCLHLFIQWRSTLMATNPLALDCSTTPF